GRLTTAGAVEDEFPIPMATAATKPGLIATGPDGALWFTEFGGTPEANYGNQVGRITPMGAIAEFTLPGLASQPDGIIVGPDNNLWFAETSGNKIGRITPAGAITEFTVPTLGGRPNYIAMGS